MINTIAGNGTGGYSGDGGPAISAQLSGPGELTLDPTGEVYFVDTGNHRVRKVDTTGIISTVAGNGTFGADGDGGPATSAQIAAPGGVAFDAKGNLYITEQGNNAVRKVDPAGIITRIAGDGTQDFTATVGPQARRHYSGRSGSQRTRKITFTLPIS